MKLTCKKSSARRLSPALQMDCLSHEFHHTVCSVWWCFDENCERGVEMCGKCGTPSNNKKIKEKIITNWTLIERALINLYGEFVGASCVRCISNLGVWWIKNSLTNNIKSGLQYFSFFADFIIIMFWFRSWSSLFINTFAYLDGAYRKINQKWLLNPHVMETESKLPSWLSWYLMSARDGPSMPTDNPPKPSLFV